MAAAAAGGPESAAGKSLGGVARDMDNVEACGSSAQCFLIAVNSLCPGLCVLDTVGC